MWLTVALHPGLHGELLLRAVPAVAAGFRLESVVSVLKNDFVSDVLKVPADALGLRLKLCFIILRQKQETEQLTQLI